MDAFGQLRGKGVNDHLLRRLFVNTARAQIEHLFVVDATYGSAVAAFHVIGVDFQLRFGVHFRQPAKQQIVVGHLPVGLNGMLRHFNQPVKDRAAFITHDGFMQLTAVAVAFVVLKPGAGVAHLVIHRQRQTVHAKRNVLAVELRAGVVAQYARAQQIAAAGGMGILRHD